MIHPVTSTYNMTINQCAPEFGLKRPGDGVKAFFSKGILDYFFCGGGGNTQF